MRIVLTGASTGIGRQLTKDLAADGHRVWALARSGDKLASLAEEANGEVRHTALDVADYDAQAACAAEIRSAWGGLDAIIACAGVQGEVGPSMGVDPKGWSDTVRVNLDGTFYTLHAFHPLLEAAERRPKVMAFSGGGATGPRVNFTGYGVSKAAVVRLIETLAHEWGDAIDINSIAPGAINTRLLDEVLALGPEKAGQKEYEAAVKRQAEGGAPIEGVTKLVRWLLSEASDGITGRLVSAVWDGFEQWPEHRDEIAGSDVFTLRRILPKERGGDWQ